MSSNVHIKNAKLQRRSRLLGPFQYTSEPLFGRLLCPSLWTAGGGQTAALDQTDFGALFLSASDVTFYTELSAEYRAFVTLYL